MLILILEGKSQFALIDTKIYIRKSKERAGSCEDSRQEIPLYATHDPW